MNESYTDKLPIRRREYLDYLTVKRPEIDEMRLARHYYHGNQWTKDELKVLKKRGQPATVMNAYARKVNGIVGVLERLKQDPKAFPRTPQHEQGAEIATAVLKYGMDAVNFDSIYPAVARECANEGISGVEYELVQGDRGDVDIKINRVPSDLFFYDPRSYEHDFSDARYMGVAKWVALDVAKEMFPEKAEELDGAIEGIGETFGADADRERKWFDAESKRIRLIDHWFIEGGEWKWCLYTGFMELASGDAFLIDEKGRSKPKYRMTSGFVDHDGDRYGFFRNMKSPQDELNHRYSKALHHLNSRRIKVQRGAVNDIERLRTEAARPDGVIEYNPGFEVEFDDQKTQADMLGQLQFLQNAKNEIDAFGPNQALIGESVQAKSGRAISLLQQAGMAELGPFVIAMRTFKLEVYRDYWNLCQRYWTGERWIRVTDDEGLAQFIQVNGVDVGPDGFPALVNALGSLDVDIILDESADTVNLQTSAFEAFSSLAQAGEQLPPGFLIDMAKQAGIIPHSMAKKYLDKLSEMQGGQQAAAQAAMQAEQMKMQVTLQAKQAETELNLQSREKEAAIDLESKARMAEIELAKKRAEADIQLRTDSVRAETERAQAEESESSKRAEEDERESEKMDAIAGMIAENQKTMVEIAAAMVKASTAPRAISISRDGSGKITGGRSEAQVGAQ